MAEEVRAEFAELAQLADQMLRSSQSISDGWRTAQTALAVPAAAFGDTRGAAAVRSAHLDTVDDADVALGRLVGVLEGDVDRLYGIAFAYKKADDGEAKKIRHPH